MVFEDITREETRSLVEELTIVFGYYGIVTEEDPFYSWVVVEVLTFVESLKETALASTSRENLQTNGTESSIYEIIVGLYVIIIKDSNLVGICQRCIGVGRRIVFVGGKESCHICVGCEIEKTGLVVVVLIEAIEVHLEGEVIAEKIYTMIEQTHKWMREGEQHHLLSVYEVGCVSGFVDSEEVRSALVVKCSLTSKKELAMAKIGLQAVTS